MIRGGTDTRAASAGPSSSQCELDVRFLGVGAQLKQVRHGHVAGREHGDGHGGRGDGPHTTAQGHLAPDPTRGHVELGRFFELRLNRAQVTPTRKTTHGKQASAWMIAAPVRPTRTGRSPIACIRPALPSAPSQAVACKGKGTNAAMPSIPRSGPRPQVSVRNRSKARKIPRRQDESCRHEYQGKRLDRQPSRPGQAPRFAEQPCGRGRIEHASRSGLGLDVPHATNPDRPIVKAQKKRVPGPAAAVPGTPPGPSRQAASPPGPPATQVVATRRAGATSCSWSQSGREKDAAVLS